jgi:hypothetical protein
MRRSQVFPLGIVAGIVLSVCAVVACGLLFFHPDPPPEEDGPAPTRITHDVDPPIEDRAPVAAVPLIVDAGVAPVVAPVVVDVAAPAVPKADAQKGTTKPRGNKHTEKEHEGREHEPASSAPKPTGLFGDDVKSLNRCAPRPTCAASVLRRANDVAAVRALSASDLAGLRDDVEWCLKQCR